MNTLDIARSHEPLDAAATPPAAEPHVREVRHEYSRAFPSLLGQLGVSLVVSTYQAGKVVLIGAHQGELTLTYHNFERAMGLALRPDRIAVGALRRSGSFAVHLISPPRSNRPDSTTPVS